VLDTWYKRTVFTHISYGRFEPDMLAFSGCYFGGGEIERRELGEIRKRWKTLHVRNHSPFMVIKVGSFQVSYSLHINLCAGKRS
jgi:hypothetical protein